MIKAPIPLNEDERLGSLLNFRVLDTESELEFDRITKIAATICKTNISLISLVDSDRQWFKSSFGLAAEETPRDISFCGHAIMDDKIFIIEDSSKDDRFKDNPLCVDAPNVIFYAGIPLVTKSGDRIGTLCVIHDKPWSLNQEQKECLKDLSLQVIKLFELKLIEKNSMKYLVQRKLDIGHLTYHPKRLFGLIKCLSFLIMTKTKVHPVLSSTSLSFTKTILRMFKKQFSIRLKQNHLIH